MKKFNSKIRAAKFAAETAVALLDCSFMESEVKEILELGDFEVITSRLLSIADQSTFTLAARLAADLEIKTTGRYWTEYKAYEVSGQFIRPVRRPTSTAERRKLSRTPRPSMLKAVL